MEHSLFFIAGAILGALWTAWVMQRALNRQTVIPTGRPSKAKVFTPTAYDVERKNRELAKRAQTMKRKEAEQEWENRTGLASSILRYGKQEQGQG